jgi:hypothetical protein
MATLPIYEETQPEFVSVREYLTTSYRPDCDYVDGRIEERNLGEFDHALLQALLGQLFLNNRDPWGVIALTDVRLQVKATRFRVPDLTVAGAAPAPPRAASPPRARACPVQISNCRAPCCTNISRPLTTGIPRALRQLEQRRFQRVIDHVEDQAGVQLVLGNRQRLLVARHAAGCGVDEHIEALLGELLMLQRLGLLPALASATAFSCVRLTTKPPRPARPGQTRPPAPRRPRPARQCARP